MSLQTFGVSCPRPFSEEKIDAASESWMSVLAFGRCSMSDRILGLWSATLRLLVLGGRQLVVEIMWEKSSPYGEQRLLKLLL